MFGLLLLELLLLPVLRRSGCKLVFIFVNLYTIDDQVGEFFLAVKASLTDKCFLERADFYCFTLQARLHVVCRSLVDGLAVDDGHFIVVDPGRRVPLFLFHRKYGPSLFDSSNCNVLIRFFNI